jgi:hypothetical protein
MPRSSKPGEHFGANCRRCHGQLHNAEAKLGDPEAIAQSYLHVVQQPRSAWTWEVELRPWVERF